MTAATKASSTVSALDVELFGARGGRPGRSAVSIIPAGGQPRDVPVAGRYELRPGDRICSASLGRYGDPSAGAAARDYGVVTNTDGTVDKDATEGLRSRMAAAVAQPAGSA